jgi:hypothetical protein
MISDKHLKIIFELCIMTETLKAALSNEKILRSYKDIILKGYDSIPGKVTIEKLSPGMENKFAFCIQLREAGIVDNLATSNEGFEYNLSIDGLRLGFELKEEELKKQYSIKLASLKK